MTQLLRKPMNKVLAPGVKLIHDINEPLKYVGFRMIELEQDAIYEEQLAELECCAVILTGKVTINEGGNIFAQVGTRNSVFEKIPTDSVYISGGKSFSIRGISEKACVALCYSPATQKLPTTLIQASDNSIEHRGKYQNKRLVHNILPDTSQIATSLLVVEVYTDSGNFSSYPPHKHDQDNLPRNHFWKKAIIMKSIHNKALCFNEFIRMTVCLMKQWQWNIGTQSLSQKAIIQ